MGLPFTNKLLVVVDVESDGPCPGLYSMVSFGAAVVEPSLHRTFYGKTAPIGDAWDPEALKVSGTSRVQHLAYPHPQVTMRDFHDWLIGLNSERLVFVSDNPAFDWQWINYYLHKYALHKPSNPFGHSARRIGDLWAGYTRNFHNHSSWKDFRQTRHTHNPVDDAMGNAEALMEVIKRMDDARKRDHV